jgi:hypothetical protein
LEVDQVRQLKQLQEENVRLKRVVADLTLDEEATIMAFEPHSAPIRQAWRDLDRNIVIGERAHGRLRVRLGRKGGLGGNSRTAQTRDDASPQLENQRPGEP